MENTTKVKEASNFVQFVLNQKYEQINDFALMDAVLEYEKFLASAPSESQSVVDNEVSKKVCHCRPIGFLLNGTKCKSCGEIMCHQTD